MINNQFTGVVPDDIERRAQEGERAALDMRQLYVLTAGGFDAEKVRDDFERIYKTLPLFDRQRVKNDLCGRELMRQAGITRFALDILDRDGEKADSRRRILDAFKEAAEIIEARKFDALGDSVRNIQRAMNANDYARFAAQLNTTPETIAAATASRGEYLATTWNLYRRSRGAGYAASRPISFAPASVSFVAAPTSHGKTAFLLNTATQFARAAKDTNRVYLFVSLEEDTEKLYIRCYNAEIDTRLHDGSAVHVDNKKVIRDYLRAQDFPGEDADRIASGIGRFWAEIAPHLKLINVGTDIEKLCGNVEAVALDLEAQGLQLGGVFVDYLQLLSAEGRFTTRTDELKTICYRLKVCAETIRVPLVCAAQLNRKASEKAEYLNGVNLTNLGESSEIEKIANDVFLLWQVDKIEADQLGTDDRKGRIKRVTQEFSEKDIRVVRNPNSGNGFLYLECLKARDFETGGCCLIEWDAQTGRLQDYSAEPYDD